MSQDEDSLMLLDKRLVEKLIDRLGEWLDERLGEKFNERMCERLGRGWVTGCEKLGIIL